MRRAFTVLRLARRLILVLLIGALAAVNIATLTSLAVFNALSGAISHVYDGATVASELVNTGKREREARSQLEAEKRKNAELTRRANALQSDLGRERARAERAGGDKARLSSIHRRIKNRTALTAATNLSAAVGEALPFVGVFVIAAATTYELSAACFTMRDMDELARMIDDDEIEAGEPADTLRVCGMQVDQNKIWQSVKAAPGDVWNGMRDLFPEELPELSVLNTEAQRGWIADQFEWAKDRIGLD